VSSVSPRTIHGRRRDGAQLDLARDAGLPLGLALVDRWDCGEEVVAARPGDTMVLMTDGLEELLPAGGLGALFGEAPAPASADELEQLRTRAFRLVDAASRRRDDATLLGLHLGERARTEAMTVLPGAKVLLGPRCAPVRSQRSPARRLRSNWITSRRI
jgi:hypothetical protein